MNLAFSVLAFFGLAFDLAFGLKCTCVNRDISPNLAHKAYEKALLEENPEIGRSLGNNQLVPECDESNVCEIGPADVMGKFGLRPFCLRIDKTGSDGKQFFMHCAYAFKVKSFLLWGLGPGLMGWNIVVMGPPCGLP